MNKIKLLKPLFILSLASCIGALTYHNISSKASKEIDQGNASRKIQNGPEISPPTANGIDLVGLEPTNAQVKSSREIANKPPHIAEGLPDESPMDRLLAIEQEKKYSSLYSDYDLGNATPEFYSQDSDTTGDSEADRINNWLVNSSQGSHQEALEVRFSEEEISYEWAKKQEQVYQDLFSTQSNLSSFALTESVCRSSQCKISVGISDKLQAEILVGELANSMIKENIAADVLLDFNEKEGSAIFYIISIEQ